MQLLGMMTGAATAPAGLRDVGLFMLAFDPALLTDAADYRHRVAQYADLVRATRPVEPDTTVRVPFERSAARRTAALAADVIDVDDTVHAALLKIIEGGR